MTLLGCAAENKPQNQLRSDGNFSAPLPKSLNAANVTENNLIVEIIIDPEKEPQDRRRLQNLVVDPESKAFSGDIPGIIPAGLHTFRLVFIFDDPTYGATEVAVSGDVNLEVIANQDTPIDFSSAVITLTDTDGDNRTNLEELERGWNPTLAAPDAPLSFSVVSGNQEVTLTWDAVTGVDSYTIYWNTGGNVSIQETFIANITDTSFVHTGRTAGTTYYYIVTATGPGGQSMPSAEDSATPKFPVPDAPINFSATPGSREVTLSWEPVQNVQSYIIYSNTSGNVTTSDSAIASVTGTSFAQTGLANGTTYYYIVTALGNEREGGPSDEVNVTPNFSAEAAHKLLASDAQPDDWFGYTVSISGDYAIVGATLEDGGIDDPLIDAGAAYIFQRTGDNTWGVGTKITAPDAQTGDQFGRSVSISGDYAIVGAAFEDGGIGDPLIDAGAAYIFRRTGDNTWGVGTKITAPDAQTGDQFGKSVSISGDYAIVSATLEDGGTGDPLSAAGAAYIFRRTGDNTWGVGTKIIAPDAQPNDQFGRSVSIISGDYAIVGAAFEDGGTGDPLIDAGAAYIFRRTGANTWGVGTKITAPDAQPNDRFGKSVSISGDYAIVGTFFEDGGTGDPLSAAGAAYIY